jgi:hypothetical protein
MTCRAPSQASTCAGTQTGAQMGYNSEGELASWQNAPTSPSTTAQYLYARYRAAQRAKDASLWVTKGYRVTPAWRP